MTGQAPAADPDRRLAALARYRALVEDWDAFCAAAHRPLPVCIWANPARADAETVAALLAEDGVPATPVGWVDGALRLPTGTRVGHHWTYRAGLCHTQEEAALITDPLLAARPGDRVLDLCAGPGNKTARIALALGNRGTVIANDIDPHRLAPVEAVVSRLGLVNVSATCVDGRRFPDDGRGFDRVLVDAPCSGEGTVRKSGQAVRTITSETRARIAARQVELLARAVALCRPGGRIVYATCTFAPEENELVVDTVLRRWPGVLRVVAAAPAGLATRPGVTAWTGRQLDPGLAGAVRLLPQLADTGGFFACALERADGAEAASAPPVARPPGPPVDAPLAAWSRHFGLPDNAFAGVVVIARGGRLRAVAADHEPPTEPAPVFSGLELARRGGAAPKLATAASLAFAQAARHQVVAVDSTGRDAFLTRGSQKVNAAWTGRPGAVLVRYREWLLGGGLVRDDRRLDSLFPRVWL